MDLSRIADKMNRDCRNQDHHVPWTNDNLQNPCVRDYCTDVFYNNNGRLCEACQDTLNSLRPLRILITCLDTLTDSIDELIDDICEL